MYLALEATPQRVVKLLLVAANFQRLIRSASSQRLCRRSFCVGESGQQPVGVFDRSWAHGVGVGPVQKYSSPQMTSATKLRRWRATAHLRFGARATGIPLTGLSKAPTGFFSFSKCWRFFRGGGGEVYPPPSGCTHLSFWFLSPLICPALLSVSLSHITPRCGRRSDLSFRSFGDHPWLHFVGTLLFRPRPSSSYLESRSS